MAWNADTEHGRVGGLFNTFLNRVTNVLIVATGFAILLMSLVYTYGSLKRYIFIAPDPYAYLGVAILMLILALMPLAGVQMMRQHIKVDFLGGHFPKVVQEIIKEILGPFMGLVFCSAIVYTSWNEAMYSLQVSQHTIAAASIPTFPFKILVPIFSGLICLVLIAQILGFLISYRGRAKSKEASVSN
jgi:TRAP-type mannitol/chloroaromatic compound transport system permease small subunit